MDKVKQWVAFAVLGAVALGAAGWFLLISPKHSAAASLRTQAEGTRESNASLQGQIARLKAQSAAAPAQQARLAAVAAKIPDNPALPSLIRSLTQAADETGVELVSLSPAAPLAVTAAAPATPVAPASAAGTVVKPVAPAAAASRAAGTLSAIGLQINVVGGYFQLEQFLDRFENLTRAAKVTALTVAPGLNPVKPPVGGATGTTAAAPPSDPGKVLQATITGTVFMATGRPTTTIAGK